MRQSIGTANGPVSEINCNWVEISCNTGQQKVIVMEADSPDDMRPGKVEEKEKKDWREGGKGSTGIR